MSITGAFATKVAMHGVAGCGVSVAGGGSCGEGFVSSGIAAGYSFLSAANGPGFTNSNWGSIIEAGVVGGGTRQLMGGSFSDGFEAGSIAQAYNFLQFVPLIVEGAIFVGRGTLAAYRAFKVWQMGRNALSSDVAQQAETTVIGKVKDLNNLQSNEKSLLDRLPDQGNAQANWKQNSGVLRQEMNKGNPIRDASTDAGGQLRDNTGFLRAERNLLENKGWTYDQSTQLWGPP